jgi:DNA-binding response OmpR family regulator
MENSNEKKIKVLLAEDDKFISRAYFDGLSRAGYEVTLASDGNQALEKINSFKPDIVLLDVIMPDKNGFEVLEEIKKNPELKNLPVIILSNLGQDTDIQKGRELGASDYLIKSNSSLDQVSAKINQYVKKA